MSSGLASSGSPSAASLPWPGAKSLCSRPRARSGPRLHRAIRKSFTRASIIRPRRSRRVSASRASGCSMPIAPNAGLRLARRQASRGRERSADAEARRNQGECRAKRRARSPVAFTGASARARTGGAVQRGLILARHRHPRQSRLHARPQRRYGERGRRHRLQQRGDKRKREEGGIVLRTQETEVKAKLVINAGGLHAPAVARSIEGMQTPHPASLFREGQLLRLEGAQSFRHLVYPMPEAAGIGIHATLDLAGRSGSARTSNGSRRSTTPWMQSARRCSRRRSDNTGQRSRMMRLRHPIAASGPRSRRRNAPAADFLIQGPDEHGIEGLWNLFRIGLARPDFVAGDGGVPPQASSPVKAARAAPPKL